MDAYNQNLFDKIPLYLNWASIAVHTVKILGKVCGAIKYTWFVEC